MDWEGDQSSGGQSSGVDKDKDAETLFNPIIFWWGRLPHHYDDDDGFEVKRVKFLVLIEISSSRTFKSDLSKFVWDLDLLKTL